MLTRFFIPVVPLAATLAALALVAGCESSDKCDDDATGDGGRSAGCEPSGEAGAGGAFDGVVVDDFEDGDSLPLVGAGWFSYTDVINGGASTLTFTGAAGAAIAMNGEGYRSQRSLEVAYTLDRGALTYSAFVGFGVALGTQAAPYDISEHTNISYTYRGGAHRLRLETFGVTDYDYHGVAVPASTAWKTVKLPIAQMAQEGWGTPVAFNPTRVGNLSFEIRGDDGSSGQLSVDDLAFESTELPRVPDLVVQPAAPPAELPIDSIAIENPLQAKAEILLDRGYNITNWLEQERFDGFRYDEAFVEQLAAAGFKSLRLPIDLDLYVTARSGTADTLELTVDDDLFVILDNFAEWTLTHGLSLTIDYHQYDRSLVLADPDSINEVVLLWGMVAEHFADDPREDLFFELMNEPELSIGGAAPTQAQWTESAERMVAAIRAVDDVHTIIFGDIEWYGIGPLSRREPLSDPNVIYAFHTYEPFIFTHQGADWTDIPATHDIPYPYTPERWSEYSTDLGFGQFTPSWLRQAAQDYYRTGHRSATWNRVVAAKRWAVENNVPVICNEFGAYDRTARLEDRARYYTDLIGIFEELSIPWQHWFMIMDAQGEVIPEYRAAFRLDEE
ncbi:MAG TPA: cellulase family glycosylhydrolase [Polyangiaceae bacterium]|nr:cellulase family glycosylhydrolase [Polyangiaceae bacterium]